MKKFFQKFKRDCRGAVTVFVTLLLIPAVLISGTGVDLARVYTARSLVRDGNQLAANAMLAEYDALLQDLYGLYGVMAEDEELAAMVDEYIRLSLGMSENSVTSDEEGVFALFRGSELEPGSITPDEDQNLANAAVLRRQIEEYAKFRAPVVIVEDIISMLESFKKVQADAKVIKEKMDIDEGIQALDEIYGKIYAEIKEADKLPASLKPYNTNVTNALENLESHIDTMLAVRALYTDAVSIGDEDAMLDLEAEYKGHLDNLKALANGSKKYYATWVPGYRDEETDEFIVGYWDNPYTVTNNLESALKEYYNALESAKSTYDELKKLCQQADAQKESLKSQIANLETSLNSGNCSEQLKTGMTVEKDSKGKTMLERYKDLLEYDTHPMATAYANHNLTEIGNIMEEVKYSLEGQAYYDKSSSRGYTIKQLAGFSASELPLHLVNGQDDSLYNLGRVSPMPLETQGNFKAFKDKLFDEHHNGDFYKMLEEMYNGAKGSKDQQKNIKNGLLSLLGNLKSLFTAFTFDPAGAHKLIGGTKTAQTTDEFTKSDWGSDEGVSNLKDSMSGSFFSSLGGLLDGAVNHVLLLTYATENFSCYTTPNSAEEGIKAEMTMTGVPLSTDVNYYFQSELEYLFHGNQTDAKANLMSITGMMLLVRFVFNYAASFAIKSVNTTVNAIKSALAWAGPVGVAVGELGRVVLALGESILDVGRLKEGDKVAVLKYDTGNDSYWRFSLSNFFDEETGAVKEMTKENIGLSDGQKEKDDDKNTATLTYKDYLRVFLLFVKDEDLASRVCDLIELNMTTKTEGIGSNDHKAMEEAMSKAERYDMSKAVTGFSLTTSVNLKMMFLSMPFAQKGLNGTVPPGSLHISATDYRGY